MDVDIQFVSIAERDDLGMDALIEGTYHTPSPRRQHLQAKVGARGGDLEHLTESGKQT